jgi:hypothetical protein
LLADLFADPPAKLATARARPFGFRQFMLDHHSRQVLGKFSPAVRMPGPNPPIGQRLARFPFDLLPVQWSLIDDLTEQQQLPRIKPFAAGAVVPPQDGQHHRSMFGLHPLALNLQLPLGFVLDPSDQRLKFLFPLDFAGHDPAFEELRIVGELVDRRHAARCNRRLPIAQEKPGNKVENILFGSGGLFLREL